MPYTTPKRVMCPFCGSRNTGKYVYGLPGPELWEAAEKPNPALIIGGCCIEIISPRGEINPSHRCHACKRDFGRPAKATYKEKGTRDSYLPCVEGANRIEFYVGGYPGSAYELVLTPDTLHLLASPDCGADLKLEKKLPCTERKFRSVVRGMFNRLFLADWQRRYEPEGFIVDGTYWALSVYLEHACRHLHFRGHCAFPPYYTQLLRLLRPLFHNNGLPFEGDDFDAPRRDIQEALSLNMPLDFLWKRPRKQP